jgi:hypothetical protein
VQRIRHQFEGNGPGRQGRGLIDQLYPLGVLDPELALIGADAVDRALVEFPRFAVAGSIYGKLDRGRAAIQDQYEQSRHEDNPSEVAATEQAYFLVGVKSNYQRFSKQ